LKALIDYFNVEKVELIKGVIGYKVNLVKEENRDINGEEIENINSEGLVTLVRVNGSEAINGVNALLVLPTPLKLLRVGIPKDLQNNENVQVEYLTFFDKDYRLVGVDVTSDFDKQFVILEFEGGYTRVISIGLINDKPKLQKARKKKSKKRKRSVKKSSGRQKVKSKSSGKS
jgi:hypothetical protein